MKYLVRCPGNDSLCDYAGLTPGRTGTVCPLDCGCELAEMALLGALALRTETPLEWDAAAMRVTNDAEANLYLDPPYRAGWKL